MTATRNGASVRPPFIDSTVAAWRDALRVGHDMQVLTGIAFVLLIIVSALNAASDYYLFAGDEKEWLQTITGMVFAAIHSLVGTPLAIAVHRYVLLGETTQRYSLDFSNPRFRRFFVFTLAFYLAAHLSIWVVPALTGGGWGALVSVILFFIVAGVALLSVMIFPAIAVDAAGASLGNALLDAKGHAWRIASIILMTAVPIFAIVILGVVLVLSLPDWTEAGIVAVIDASITLGMFTGVPAAASRLYAAYGDRLGRPRNLRLVDSAAG